MLVPYLPNLKSLLSDYRTVKNICYGLIRILVLVAQIGEQSIRSILLSGILNNIDDVIMYHISHKSLILNIFTLFHELSTVPEGANYLATHNFFSVSIKVIQRFLKDLPLNSEESAETVEKVLSTIQFVIEKQPNTMRSFLETSGYSVILSVCTSEMVSRGVRRAALNCLMLLLQSDLGDEQLRSLNLISRLLQSETDVSWVIPIWFCCRYTIQYHSGLVTMDELMLIEESAVQCIAKSIEDRNLMNAVVQTIFVCATCPGLVSNLWTQSKLRPAGSGTPRSFDSLLALSGKETESRSLYGKDASRW